MNQILGDYDAFIFPFIFSHPLLFVPPSLKPVLCRKELGSRECCKFSSQWVRAKPGR